MNSSHSCYCTLSIKNNDYNYGESKISKSIENKENLKTKLVGISMFW